MEIYPALDLLDGQCVRLKRGNFDDKTVYSEDPKNTIRYIEELGAQHLHLVDLSGAKDPANRQTGVIGDLVSGSHMKIQCGGGIRTRDDIQGLLDLGIERVVLGSIAITDLVSTLSWLEEFGPDRITLACDVRIQSNGLIRMATHGWQDTSDEDLFDWINYYLTGGLKRILCTDIDRDGMMTHPNFNLYQGLIREFPQIEFQASGGLSGPEDLAPLRAMNIHSVIVGRAFYENKLNLKEGLI